LAPRIFFPPSMPRAKQLGAERQVRLSMATALGSGAAQLVDGPPLHATETNTPDRHHRLA
jgi:hypothetical protein